MSTPATSPENGQRNLNFESIQLILPFVGLLVGMAMSRIIYGSPAEEVGLLGSLIVYAITIPTAICVVVAIKLGKSFFKSPSV